jgi:hypothetical protein
MRKLIVDLTLRGMVKPFESHWSNRSKKSFIKRLFWAMLVWPILLAAQQQKALTNVDILDMVRAKLSDSVIVAEISKSTCKFSTGPRDLIALKRAGVSDRVLEAMTSAGSAPATAGTPVAVSSTGPAGISTASRGLPHEVGVYIKKAGVWVDLPPEVVNWKTGGVLKSIGTVGVVKGDINGNLRGEHSPTGVKTSLEFLVVVAEGSYITEYQLIHLRPHKDGREFRTVTGGVLHASGGATRDVLPLTSEKVADRTFHVQLDNLASGDYGFLPPGNATSKQEMSSLGKLYSFHVIQ